MKRAHGAGSDGTGEFTLRPRSRHFEVSPEERLVDYLVGIADGKSVDRGTLLEFRSLARRCISEATIESSRELLERKARTKARQDALEELGAVEMRDYLRDHFNNLEEQVERAPPLLKSRLADVVLLPRETAAARISAIMTEYDTLIAGVADAASHSSTWGLHKTYYTGAATAFHKYATDLIIPPVLTPPPSPLPVLMLPAFCAAFDKFAAGWSRQTISRGRWTDVHGFTLQFAQLTSVVLSKAQVTGAPSGFYRSIEGDERVFATDYRFWVYVSSILMDCMEELRGYERLCPDERGPRPISDCVRDVAGGVLPSKHDIGEWIGRVYNPKFEEESKRQYDEDIAKQDAYNAVIRPGECDATLAIYVHQRNKESHLAQTLFQPEWPLSAADALSVINAQRPDALAAVHVEPRFMRVLLSALVSSSELGIEQATAALKTRVELRNSKFAMRGKGITLVEVNAFTQEYLCCVDDGVYGPCNATVAAGLFLAITEKGCCKRGERFEGSGGGGSGGGGSGGDDATAKDYFVEIKSLRDITSEF